MSTSSTPKIVLDDDLFEIYALFRSGYCEAVNVNILEKLISFLKLEVAFPSVTQIKAIQEKYGDKLVYLTNIAPAVASSSASRVSLEEVAMQTTHKIILTQDNAKTIPYVSIHDKKIDSVYIMHCKQGGDRCQLITHIRNLCMFANEICICDLYLDKIIQAQWGARNYFADIFPDKKMKLYFSENKMRKNKGIKIYCKDIRDKVKALAKGTQWEICLNNEPNNIVPHDRYIRIDKKYEIMLSSGIEHLFGNKKEITCVFREIS